MYARAAQGPIDNLVDHLSDPYHVTFACAINLNLNPRPVAEGSKGH